MLSVHRYQNLSIQANCTRIEISVELTLFDFNHLVERKMSLLFVQKNTFISKEFTLFASLLFLIARQNVTGNDEVS